MFIIHLAGFNLWQLGITQPINKINNKTNHQPNQPVFFFFYKLSDSPNPALHAVKHHEGAGGPRNFRHFGAFPVEGPPYPSVLAHQLTPPLSGAGHAPQGAAQDRRDRGHAAGEGPRHAAPARGGTRADGHPPERV